MVQIGQALVLDVHFNVILLKVMVLLTYLGFFSLCYLFLLFVFCLLYLIIFLSLYCKFNCFIVFIHFTFFPFFSFYFFHFHFQFLLIISRIEIRLTLTQGFCFLQRQFREFIDTVFAYQILSYYLQLTGKAIKIHLSVRCTRNWSRYMWNVEMEIEIYFCFNGNALGKSEISVHHVCFRMVKDQRNLSRLSW